MDFSDNHWNYALAQKGHLPTVAYSALTRNSRISQGNREEGLRTGGLVLVDWWTGAGGEYRNITQKASGKDDKESTYI